jgi:hypothetical protein
VSHVAPTELGKLLRNVFYKHFAPLALQNLGIRQQYQDSPHSIRFAISVARRHLCAADCVIAKRWRCPRNRIISPTIAGVAINASPIGLVASSSNFVPALTT